MADMASSSWVMPSSSCAPHSEIHLLPNSVFSSRIGMKLPAKAPLRPSASVPTMSSMGISMTPRSTFVAAEKSGMVFSSEGI